MTYTEFHMAPVLVMMDQSFSLETLSSQDSLDLRCIGAKAWEAILASCNASELSLYYLKIPSLAGVDRLRRTVKLRMESANKVEDISPLFAMPWLRSLTLYDFPCIRRLDGIEALEDLRELQLSGNCGSTNPPLKLESLRPIASLRYLEKLEIVNLRLEDRDISFIGSAFPKLRSLSLSGKEFERAQLAYLAKRLNPQLDEPFVGSWEMKSAPCKCGQNRHLFMGRRMGMLCPLCDEKIQEAHRRIPTIGIAFWNQPPPSRRAVRTAQEWCGKQCARTVRVDANSKLPNRIAPYAHTPTGNGLGLDSSVFAPPVRQLSKRPCSRLISPVYQ
jgi:hypothetical protein